MRYVHAMLICGCLAAGALAGGDRAVSQSTEAEPAYRNYGRDLAHYATVTRPGGVTRRLFVDRAALALLREGVLADRTMLAMEVFTGGASPDRLEVKRWKDGAWAYATHAPTDALWAPKPDAICDSCHARAAGRFEVFTFPSLVRFARSGVIDRFDCAVDGREPCDDPVYRRE